jgi:hypothetical protein
VNHLHLKIPSFIQYLLPTSCRKLFVINYCSDMFRPQFLAIFVELTSIFFYLNHVKLKWITLMKVLITSSMWLCFLLNITFNWCIGITCMFCEYCYKLFCADDHVMNCNTNLEISVRYSENMSMKAVQRAQVLFHVSSPIADFFID